MDLGLGGARVLVTGGSGGIGQATVRAFAAEGAQVIVHAHSQPEAARALATEVGGRALTADLTVEDEVAALFEAAGPLDACVANAGVWPSEDVPVAGMTLARWRQTIEVNLTSVFLTCRGFLAGLRERGADHGALVLVASTAGRFGEAGHADYAAAKAALAYGLLASLKNEIALDVPRGRVNAVAPGWTSTPMAAARLTPAAVARATATMALGKVATPEDIANTILWLCSDRAAGHVTGELITVAGGMEGRLLRDPAESGRDDG